MALTYSREERNMRFKMTQIGRYVIAVLLITGSFGLVFFPPTKDPTPYIGFSATLLALIGNFFFGKTTSNEKIKDDATSIEEDTTTAKSKAIPFSGYGDIQKDLTPDDYYVGSGKIFSIKETPSSSSIDDSVEPAKSFDEILADLKKEVIEVDKLEWNSMIAAMRFKVWLYNNVPLGSANWKAGLEKAIELTKTAYAEIIGVNPPDNYAVMSNYNKFLASLKKDITKKYGCNAVSGELVRVPVMTLRELYKRYEEFSSN